MKIQGLIVLFMLLGSIGKAQQTKAPAIDRSSMDMSYYPVNYPVLKIQGKVTDPLVARVIYSRPQKAGRRVFTELLDYGEVWRLGANEATEIEFFIDVKVNGAKIKKGRYTMYCIPAADKWTIIFNKDTDTWGTFKYDSTKDVLRTVTPVITLTEPQETFSIWFEKTNPGAYLFMEWDDERIQLQITF